MDANEWFKKGALIEVNGFKHFVYDSQSDKPCLLILHGFPTCIYDFHKVLPLLEQHFRVVMHDHLGFGYSDKPQNYSYSLMEQADQALLLWQSLGITQGVVLAHDYGTSIATEIVARLNRFKAIGLDVSQMILCNGSMHVEMAQLRLIQKLLLNKLTGPLMARLSSRKTLARNMKNIYSNPALVSDQEVDALFQMMNHNHGRRVLHQVSQYLKQRYKYWHRWIGALKETDLPMHIIWAKDDPVAVYEMAVTLHEEIKNSQLVTLEDSGHFPMLEKPQQWSDAVLSALLNH